jgi:D-arabinose 1-dehydrogenase-like Zn-dependent alcohol dehydrogenase
VRALGADTVINTAVPDDALAQAFTEARGEGYDIVLDFLWGRPTEILLRTLIPASVAFAKPTRLVQAGESAGPALTVAAASLRTSGVEIYGAARGLDPAVMAQTYGQIVRWAQDGTLTFEAEKVPLSEIEAARRRPGLRGRRLVVVP